MYKDKRKEAEKQEKSRELEKHLVKLVWPVLVELKQKLDRLEMPNGSQFYRCTG